MNKEDKFEKITIDLRPFGWGIRDVDVIWPEGHDGGKPGPDSVGSEEIVDHGVKQDDLDPEIEAGEEDIDSIFNQQSGASNAGGAEDGDKD